MLCHLPLAYCRIIFERVNCRIINNVAPLSHRKKFLVLSVCYVNNRVGFIHAVHFFIIVNSIPPSPPPPSLVLCIWRKPPKTAVYRQPDCHDNDGRYVVQDSLSRSSAQIKLKIFVAHWSTNILYQGTTCTKLLATYPQVSCNALIDSSHLWATHQSLWSF